MVRFFRNALRLIRIVRVLAWHNALFPIEHIERVRPLLRLVQPFVRRNAPGRPGERLAAALQDLGPTFIKLGQSLAVRSDLMGEPIAQDLSKLQDRLPPFDAEIAHETISQELGRPLKELFRLFNDKPVAAASIAQVHKAELPDGQCVAVKILRPGIETAIERDLDLLLWIAEVTEWVQPQLRRYKPVENVNILIGSTRRELDLRLEAAAACELSANCRDDYGFCVPQIIWELTAQRVVTFAWVEGLSVKEPDRLRKAGLDPDVIMEHAARVFFNQVFRDGFFHADMHPGNMMVDQNGTIIALDFGIMGRLDMPTRRYLARILIGFLQADYQRVADVFFDAGFLPGNADRQTFAQACRAIGEPILGRPLVEISIGRLLGQVLAVAEQFDMRTRPELLLLQKTIVVAEGVGRVLNPNLNMWQLAEPLVGDWIRKHLGPQAEIRQALIDGASAVRKLPALVDRADELVSQLSQPRYRSQQRRHYLAWLLAVFVGFLLGAVLF